MTLKKINGMSSLEDMASVLTLSDRTSYIAYMPINNMYLACLQCIFFRQKEAAGQASKIANLEATLHQQQEKLKIQEQVCSVTILTGMVLGSHTGRFVV